MQSKLWIANNNVAYPCDDLSKRWAIYISEPQSTRRTWDFQPDVGLMLGQRLQRRPDINTTIWFIVLREAPQRSDHV